MDKLLRIVIMCGDRSGPFYHQYAVPMKYINDLHLMDMHATDMVDMSLLGSADIIEFQRQYAPECMVVQKQLKKLGRTTIFHVDDNVWEIPNGNPAKSVYVAGSPVMQRFEHILRNCDAVTTSTPYLKELAEKAGNKNVHIMRNLVEVDFIRSFMSPGRDNPDEIRVGWTGTPHHHDDIQIVEPILGELLKKYPQVKLVFMGYAPVDKGVLHANLSRWEYYEFVQVDAFYPALANMDFDIGIAPLADVPFNKAKTARKAQEYATLKVPMILSPMEAYSQWEHEDTCLKPLRNKPTEWMRHFEWMITHPKERAEMAERAYQQVVREHDIKTLIYERVEQYKEIHRLAQQGRQ